MTENLNVSHNKDKAKQLINDAHVLKANLEIAKQNLDRARNLSKKAGKDYLAPTVSWKKLDNWPQKLMAVATPVTIGPLGFAFLTLEYISTGISVLLFGIAAISFVMVMFVNFYLANQTNRHIRSVEHNAKVYSETRIQAVRKAAEMLAFENVWCKNNSDKKQAAGCLEACGIYLDELNAGESELFEMEYERQVFTEAQELSRNKSKLQIAADHQEKNKEFLDSMQSKYSSIIEAAENVSKFDAKHVDNMNEAEKWELEFKKTADKQKDPQTSC